MEESTLQNRRNFIKKVGLGTAGIVGLSSFGMAGMETLLKDEFIRLTVLHTNDMHSTVESFPKDHKKYPGQGGMVNVGKTIQELRKE